MSKVKNLVVFGVGYVLGAQAGRSRYEQLKERATRIAEHPRTQQLARTAREQATTCLPASVGAKLPASVSARFATPSPATDTTIDPTTGATVDHDTRPSHL